MPGVEESTMYGKPALKQRLLPLLATGERIAAFAATEPGAGSDLSLLSTHLRPDGSRVRLSRTRREAFERKLAAASRRTS